MKYRSVLAGQSGTGRFPRSVMFEINFSSFLCVGLRARGDDNTEADGEREMAGCSTGVLALPRVTY